MNVLIVPVYIKKIKEIAMLRKLVSLVENDPGIDHVIIVDDCSPLKYDLHPYVKIGREQIKLRSNRGPAHARNIGIERSFELGATNLFFTDHDCELMPGWGMAFENFLANNPYSIAGGITLSAGNTILDRYHNINGTLNGRLVIGKDELLYAPSCNLAMRACVSMDFRFDESFPNAAGEDVDFCLRARNMYNIGLCREAVVHHNWGYRSTISGLPKFVQTFSKYKAANSLLRSKHSRIKWGSEAIPSI